jgi:hypothetical protein
VSLIRLGDPLFLARVPHLNAVDKWLRARNIDLIWECPTPALRRRQAVASRQETVRRVKRLASLLDVPRQLLPKILIVLMKTLESDGQGAMREQPTEL